jgi:hypothetical protein
MCRSWRLAERLACAGEELREREVTEVALEKDEEDRRRR